MRTPTFKAWLVLVGMQALVAALLFGSFIAGPYHFAYLDIGIDTYGQLVPFAMHAARQIAAEGFAGWSFQIGLGSPTAWMLSDPFMLLSLITGPQGVLPLRIWVYLLKILLGGTSFFLLARCYTTRREAAVIAALAYSFCGYIVVNGQWDPEANAFICFPLVLWAVERHLRAGSLLALPLTVAASLAGGIFFVTLGAFLLMAGIAHVAVSPDPRAMLRRWATGVLPLAALGYLLAAPLLLPVVLQMLDSPRVTGAQSLLADIWRQSLAVNSWPLIATEIGGLFHKDIYGIGNSYTGYVNYLEGPDFYIGVMALLVIPQMWSRSAQDRRVMVIGLLAVLAYFLFPAIRFAAMGFSAHYFRSSLLWPTLVLLLLAVRSIDHILDKGVDARLLAAGAAAWALLLALAFSGGRGDFVQMNHAQKIVGLGVLAVALLGLASRRSLPARWLPMALLCAVFIEIVLVAKPSYFEGRAVARADTPAHADGTAQALQRIRELDKGVFRIEKTYATVSYADSLAQDYMGVKSNHFHSSGAVDFNVATGLIPPAAPPDNPNYTNWLPGPGQRYFLNSLLGVKYIVAKAPLDRPGFTQVGQMPGLLIYRNDAALPLGFVQTRQVPRAALARRLAALPADQARFYTDVILFNAAVLDDPDVRAAAPLDLEALLRNNTLSMQDWYGAPAATLQRTGLKLTQFSSTRLAGSITPDQAGMLVFSIPYSTGWTLRLDGQPTPLTRADFGMLAAPVTAGPHQVELEFKLPGRQSGLLLGATGLAMLVLVFLRQRRG